MFLIVSAFDPNSRKVISELQTGQCSSLTTKQKTAICMDVFLAFVLVVIIVSTILATHVNLGSSIGSIGGGFPNLNIGDYLASIGRGFAG